MTMIVQLTDLHIREPKQLAYGRVDTGAYLRACVTSVKGLRQRPDAVVITGDLADFGRPGEYAYLKQLLIPLEMPIYLLPGNHDDRENLREGFPEQAYLGKSSFIQYAVDVADVRLIALDTSIPGESAGTLCDSRLDWLDATLRESQHRPVVIAMHHPPFRTLIGHMDDIGLQVGGDALESLVSQYTNVERIICGHLHRAIDVRFGGTIASTAPGPAHQITLDLDPQAQPTWMLEPPGFRIHAWDAASHRMVTHLAPIGQFAGPYPFHENGTLMD